MFKKVVLLFLATMMLLASVSADQEEFANNEVAKRLLENHAYVMESQLDDPRVIRKGANKEKKSKLPKKDFEKETLRKEWRMTGY